MNESSGTEHSSLTVITALLGVLPRSGADAARDFLLKALLIRLEQIRGLPLSYNRLRSCADHVEPLRELQLVSVYRMNYQNQQ